MMGATGDAWKLVALALLASSFFAAVVNAYVEGEWPPRSEEQYPFGGRGGSRGKGGGSGEEEEERPFGRREGGGGRQGMFMLGKAQEVVRTDAGVVRVVRGYMWKGMPSTMHIGFIDMEPNSLFLPQYMDANLILFIRRGEARVGMIYEEDMAEKDLKVGDVYRIPSGSPFYIVNTGYGQKLQIICSIDTSGSFEPVMFQSFYIGGGSYPTSVLSGFDISTLATAFNVSSSEVSEITTRQSGGPIIHMTDEPTRHSMRLAKMMRLRQKETRTAKDDPRKKGRGAWTWSKFVNVILAREVEEGNARNENKESAPDAYNLYDSEPDFQNTYGWTVALDEEDYSPLERSGIGIYLVNLTAGSMLAPHVNPLATEYGVVLSGAGRIQVVFPNGSSAMNTEVEAGDTFWIPRYFPFCQIASQGGALEFFGFTTSARRNEPQFLVGASSVLRSMKGPELAAGFDVSEEALDELVMAQRESIILPSWPPTERGGGGRGREGGEEGDGGREGEGEGGGQGRREGGDEPMVIRRLGAA